MRNAQFEIKTFWDDTLKLYIKEATSASENHLRSIQKIHLLLHDIFIAHEHVQIIPSTKISKTQLSFPKSPGKSLLKSLKDGAFSIKKVIQYCEDIQKSLSKAPPNQDTLLFGSYAWRIYPNDSYVTGIIDITASNIFFDHKNSVFRLIDQEWHTQSIPRLLLLFRVINDLRYRDLIMGKNYVKICVECGIPKWKIPFLRYHENNFATYVGLRNKPSILTFIWDVYRTYANQF